MVIMALDHVRDYFHYGSFLLTLPISKLPHLWYFLPVLLHITVPRFLFLAGTSAFLYGSNKSRTELFKFLITRGLWLILLEMAVNNLIWTFDFTYSIHIFQVIWAIGFSMVCLSFFIFLPKKLILVFGVLLIAGHNMLDSVVLQGQSFQSIAWSALHQQNLFIFNPNHLLIINIRSSPG